MTSVRTPASATRASMCLAGLCLVLAIPALARADVAMVSMPRDTPISAYKGTLAWSEWDTVKQQYRLVLTTVKTGKATKPKIGLRKSPFDVTLGPDSDGKTVALYSRCSKSDGTKCDAYRYDLAKKKESKLDFSRSDRDEAWPSQWQGRYAWVEQRGKGDDPNDFKDGNCDAPMTRAVSSSSAVKKLSTGTCGTVTGQAPAQVDDRADRHVGGRHHAQLQRAASAVGQGRQREASRPARRGSRAGTSTPRRCSTTSSSTPSGRARAPRRASCGSSAAPARCS